MKLFKGRFNATIRRNNFSQRIIDYWHNPSDDVIASNSVLQFKKGWIFSRKRGFIHVLAQFILSDAVWLNSC